MDAGSKVLCHEIVMVALIGKSENTDLLSEDSKFPLCSNYSVPFLLNGKSFFAPSLFLSDTSINRKDKNICWEGPPFSKMRPFYSTLHFVVKDAV